MRTPLALLACVAVVCVACEAGVPTVDAPTGRRPSADTTVSPSPESSPSSSPSPARAREPFFVAVKGDWGSGTDDQRAVTAAMCAQRTRTPFVDVITTGDNFYAPDGRATDANFTSPERCLTRAGVRWHASWGNHDLAGNSTGEALGAKRYYAWNTHGVRFIALDANDAASEAQRSWLRDRLASAGDRRIIVSFHQPPYTAGSVHEPDATVRARWVPLFVRYGVDLVLNGHQHVYEHHRARGIDYVVTGGGGRALYACASRPASLVRCSATYHFVLLRIEAHRIVVRAIRTDGSRLDRFTIAT